MEYFQKMRGVTKSLPGPEWQEIAWSWLGAFVGIAAVSSLNYTFLADSDLILIIGSFLFICMIQGWRCNHYWPRCGPNPP